MKKTIITTLIAAASMGVSLADDADGKAAYAMCAACHGADGKGMDVGAKKMAPTLEKSKIVNGDASVFALVVLKGIKKEGDAHIGIMAPLEGVYSTDKKLAAVLTYVRKSFGNTSKPVTEEDAAKFRAKWKDHKEPVTRAKLAELQKAGAEKK
ncbi:MAG: c-type cytochrome [Akkermansiaceae bacterium]